jgi:S1-C subfamily serine protease
VVLVVALGFAPRHIFGQPAPGAGSPGLAYDTVDEATVRIFAVGTVGVERFETKDRRFIDVATPRSGHGTGFAVSAAGLIMTAHHVVDEARHVVVRLPGDGGFYSARVVYADKETDIALLHVDAAVPSLAITPDASMRVRQSVFTVGYPIDPTRKQPQSSRGIVAGQLDNGTLQLDMAVNPGNSGGPLLDEEDRVVGRVIARGNVEAGVQGIGFAVPAARLSAAVAEAQRRLDGGKLLALTAQAREAAVVVDELIQQGVLHEVSESKDLKDGLSRADVDRAIDSLIARINDADLLVFVAGTLWNGALALDVAGVRKVGNTTLSDGDAGALAQRLRQSSIDACRRAVTIDDKVRDRSPFVALAAPKGSGSPGSGAPTVVRELPPAGPRPVEVRARLSPHLRLNPSGRAGWGFGAAFGVARSQSAMREAGVRWTPVLGGAFARVSFDGSLPGETIGHAFFVAEIGAEYRLGTGARHVVLSGVYAPGYYSSSVEDARGPLATAETFTLLHFRAAAAYRAGWFEVGVGARTLSGPTFWLEPVFVGGAF